MRKQQFDHDSALIVPFYHGKARRFRSLRVSGHCVPPATLGLLLPRAPASQLINEPHYARDSLRDLADSRHYPPVAPARDGATTAPSAPPSPRWALFPKPDALSFGGPTEYLPDGDMTPEIASGTSRTRGII